MPQTEVWLRDYAIIGNPGTGTEDDPFDASTADLFDGHMRDFHDELGNPPYYIHLGTGTFYTKGIQVDDETGWRMGNGWTIAGAGVGATLVQLTEFTTSEDAGPKRSVIGSTSDQNVAD